jgi:hypothetical protein
VEKRQDILFLLALRSLAIITVVRKLADWTVTSGSLSLSIGVLAAGWLKLLLHCMTPGFLPESG